MTAIRCVCVSKRSRKMIVSKAVVSAVFIIATLNKVPAKPQPSIIRERHIIRAPINFRVIHHYKIKKVPVVIKKHLHYHEARTERVKPALEEVHADDSNEVSPPIEFLHREEGEGHSTYAGVHLKGDREATVPHYGKAYSFRFHVQQQRGPREEYEESQEEEYEDVEDSRENYNDYE